MNTQRPDKSIYHNAAEICLYAPIISIAIFYFTKDAKISVSYANKAILIITTAFYLIGLASGVVALFGIRKHGTKGILKKTLIGLSITGIIIAIAIPNFIQYRAKSEQAKMQLNELRDLSNNALEEVSEDGMPGEKTEKFIKQSQKIINKQVESSSGDEKLALEVIMKLNSTIQEKAKDFYTKMSAMNEHFWDYASLKTDVDYKQRYNKIEAAYKSATDIIKLYRNIDKNLDSLLEGVNINENIKLKAKKGFLSTFNRNSDKGIRLYDLNAQQLIKIKAFFNFLQKNKENWGIENGSLVFDQEPLVQEFNDRLSVIEKMDLEKTKIIKSIPK